MSNYKTKMFSISPDICGHKLAGHSHTTTQVHNNNNNNNNKNNDNHNKTRIILT